MLTCHLFVTLATPLFDELTTTTTPWTRHGYKDKRVGIQGMPLNSFIFIIFTNTVCRCNDSEERVQPSPRFRLFDATRRYSPPRRIQFRPFDVVGRLPIHLVASATVPSFHNDHNMDRTATRGQAYKVSLKVLLIHYIY